MKGRTCFESIIIITACVIKFQRSRYLRGKNENHLQISSIKNEICDELEKQEWLQHRLQLGIPPSCEAGRIVDHVPILGKWSQKLSQVESFLRIVYRRWKKASLFAWNFFFKIRYSFQTRLQSLSQFSLSHCIILGMF